MNQNQWPQVLISENELSLITEEKIKFFNQPLLKNFEISFDNRNNYAILNITIIAKPSLEGNFISKEILIILIND